MSFVTTFPAYDRCPVLRNNLANGWDDGASNSWDDGIGRGNQWKDYNGIGNYSISGSTNSFDNYPSVVAPYLDSPQDIQYEAGLTGNTITWDSFALNSESFFIFRNESRIDSGVWDG
jgi:hypothetical protein